MSLFDRQAKYAFAAAVIVLAGSRLGFGYAQRLMGAYLSKEAVPLRAELARIPRWLGDWAARGDDQLLDEAMLESLGTRVYLNRAYVSKDGSRPSIHVHVAYYTGLIDPVPHVPDRCFVAGGMNAKTLPENVPLAIDDTEWTVHPDRINEATGEPYRSTEVRHPITREVVDVMMPIGTIELRTTEFEDERRPNVRIFSGYFFIANGRLTPSPDGVRLMAFDLFERYAYYCKVQLTVTAPAPYDRAQFIALSTDFLNEFLPEVMRCLPDWWVLESSAAPDEAADRESERSGD